MASTNSLGGLAIAGAFGAALISSMAQADPGDGRYDVHHGMMGWDGWFYGPVTILLLFALLVSPVVVVVRLLGSDTLRNGAKLEEFEVSRKVLDGGAS